MFLTTVNSLKIKAIFLQLDEEKLEIIHKCNEQLNLSENELLKILGKLSEICKNKSYIRELLAVNNSINTMAEDN